MIKVSQHGTTEERFRKIEQSINYSSVTMVAGLSPVNLAVPTTGFSTQVFNVDRSWSRKLFPDAQWIVRAAGFVNPVDANGVTVSLFYQKDNTALVVLGTATFTGAGFVKVAVGPFDVFATAGVPAGETIPILGITFTKLVSGTASVTPWTVWLELRAPKQ